MRWRIVPRSVVKKSIVLGQSNSTFSWSAHWRDSCHAWNRLSPHKGRSVLPATLLDFLFRDGMSHMLGRLAKQFELYYSSFPWAGRSKINFAVVVQNAGDKFGCPSLGIPACSKIPRRISSRTYLLSFTTSKHSRCVPPSLLRVFSHPFWVRHNTLPLVRQLSPRQGQPLSLKAQRAMLLENRSTDLSLSGVRIPTTTWLLQIVSASDKSFSKNLPTLNSSQLRLDRLSRNYIDKLPRHHPSLSA